MVKTYVARDQCYKGMLGIFIIKTFRVKVLVCNKDSWVGCLLLGIAEYHHLL